ncbi:hypothetical protein BU23DRAFT_551952 [Bimuria novae-zelandiae CBS 107.79]|uniref:Uncharacterized protein n=1 Tax=Bimuria novae-zelandiae CBS 107.79 TaxID=1447943 RepID=A0A6A5VHP6_9PLEO|nr:hypothetical protein BU23DRAFT_551952 [Bimuria novae-zelandiae CBS 107.79]
MWGTQESAEVGHFSSVLSRLQSNKESLPQCSQQANSSASHHTSHKPTMPTLLAIISFLLTLTLAASQDLCPKNEYACLDIINSSQCLAPLVLQKTSPLTNENMIKCINYEGVVSNLAPAEKFCRCPGCHTEPINKAIRDMFPGPCG